jgi:hypothetical protein
MVTVDRITARYFLAKTLRRKERQWVISAASRCTSTDAGPGVQGWQSRDRAWRSGGTKVYSRRCAEFAERRNKDPWADRTSTFLIQPCVLSVLRERRRKALAVVDNDKPGTPLHPVR